MGGTLARPQDHWSALFANPFWGNYPYFLPCAMAACLFVLALFMMSIFLEEVGPIYCIIAHVTHDRADIINKASAKADISHARCFK
jgi:hypothetical protein